MRIDETMYPIDIIKQCAFQVVAGQIAAEVSLLVCLETTDDAAVYRLYV